MTNLVILNKNIRKTREWLNYIEEGLGFENDGKDQALAILRAVLQTLRDHLSVNEIAHFSAQLPIVIRGLLYEHWVPQRTLIKDKSKEGFISDVRNKIPAPYRHLDIERVIRAVFSTMAAKIDYGEFLKILSVLPHHIRGIVTSYASLKER